VPGFTSRESMNAMAPGIAVTRSFVMSFEYTTLGAEADSARKILAIQYCLKAGLRHLVDDFQDHIPLSRHRSSDEQYHGNVCRPILPVSPEISCALRRD